MNGHVMVSQREEPLDCHAMTASPVACSLPKRTTRGREVLTGINETPSKRAVTV